jgi:V/A-type H+-transporting ATPase subunit I
MSRIGEDLVHIYDTPSITDKDPSTWVLWSFALFFAIILGDGGYGILFLMVSLGLWFKFPKAKGLLRRVMKLSTILSVSCIIWGVLTNSFFGISFDLDSGVRQVSGLQWLVEQKADYHFAMQDAVYQDWADKYPAVASASNGYEMLERAVSEHGGKSIWKMLAKFSDSIMLELALVIGIIHLSLSLLRSFRDSWAGLGWILFMVGGYLYVPEYLACTSMAQFLGGVDKTLGAQLGMQMLQVGLGGAVLLAVIQHRMGGLGEIINVIQVFADVLSYLRLYALGLAGSMMSSTFNEIGSSAPFVAGFFIIFIGHVVNIVLSIMGGVIHGLRLNFLEWYHYCFEGGGKMFKPLEMLKVKERN